MLFAAALLLLDFASVADVAVGGLLENALADCDRMVCRREVLQTVLWLPLLWWSLPPALGTSRAAVIVGTLWMT